MEDALDADPSRFPLGRLRERFESVVALGFADYVKSREVHKRFSRPTHGAFARQFREDTDYRAGDTREMFRTKGVFRFVRPVRDGSLGERRDAVVHPSHRQSGGGVRRSVRGDEARGVVYRTLDEYERTGQGGRLRSPL